LAFVEQPLLRAEHCTENQNAQALSRTVVAISEICYNRSGAPVQEATTVGQRVYLVRLACGDGVRKAMPMREFAEMAGFHTSRISDIENDKSKPGLEEVEALAAVDPLKRGPSWLAGWGEPQMREAPPAAEPVVRQDPGTALDVSGYASPKRHRRRSNGEAG
jgi:transcriptional regulator with XRE-family HTH domain